MRYRELHEFVSKKEKSDKFDSKVNAGEKNQKSLQSSEESQPQNIQMTPQLRAAIYASIPAQSDPQIEAKMFELVLSKITDVNKFLAMNHSDIRHYLASNIVDHPKVDDDEIEDAIKNASPNSNRPETSRESDNNYLRQAGNLLNDDIYRVTMTRQNESGISHIDQVKLDAVSKNEGKRYSAKKFDHTIRDLYRTNTYVAVLIENLNEASCYLIILCDLATGKIYCGRRYARLILVTTDSGDISRKLIRSKVVYNENSTAQQSLFRTVVPQIESYDAFMRNRDIEGLFVTLGVPFDRQVPVKQRSE